MILFIYCSICLFIVASPHRKASDALIEKDIEGDTSGDFKRLLVAASQVCFYKICLFHEALYLNCEIDGHVMGLGHRVAIGSIYI